MNNLYIFYGSDSKKIEDTIHKLVEAAEMPSKRVSDVVSIVNHLYTKSLIDKHTAFIVQFDIDFLKAEKYWQTICDNIGDNMLILIYTELDKRSKFYKFFSKYIVEYSLGDAINYTFEFVDKFCLNSNDAIDVIPNIEEDNIIGVLSLLYNKVRMLLQIQETPEGVNILDNTGISSGELYYAKKYLNIYSSNELISTMQLIDKIIVYIKKGVLIGKEALQYLVVYTYSKHFTKSKN